MTTPARRAYTVFVIPAAYKDAINVALAIVNGDDPTVSQSCKVGANPSGSWEDPETHYYGGMYTSEAWEVLVSNLSASMVAAAWPVNGVTEAQAMAAAAQLRLQTTVRQDGVNPDPLGTLENALANYSPPLQRITPPPMPD